MKYIYVSTSQKTYNILSPETHVFFVFNRTKDIEIYLNTKNCIVYVYALYIAKNNKKHTLKVHLHHIAQKTTSRVLVKAILTDSSNVYCKNLTTVEPTAHGTNADQRINSLLLSGKASICVEPVLEVLTPDVQCTHAATAGNASKEMTDYLETRGLRTKQAKKILYEGFIDDFFDTMCTVSCKNDINKHKERAYELLKEI